MPLPILEVPEFDLTLPITKAKIKFRPFLAKEQKILLLAAESKEQSMILNTIGQLVDSCCKNLPCPSSKLPLVDIETIFLNLRMKSVGESVKVNIKCPHCEAINELNVNLEDIQIVNTTGHSKTVKLTDKIGVVMKYPCIDSVSSFAGTSLDPENTNFAPSKLLDVIQESIEAVVTDTEKYPFSEATPEEKSNFINSLSVDNLQKITGFYESLPQYKKTFNLVCIKCKKDFDLKMETIYDFFT